MSGSIPLVELQAMSLSCRLQPVTMRSELLHTPYTEVNISTMVIISTMVVIRENVSMRGATLDV